MTATATRPQGWASVWVSKAADPAIESTRPKTTYRPAARSGIGTATGTVRSSPGASVPSGGTARGTPPSRLRPIAAEIETPAIGAAPTLRTDSTSRRSIGPPSAVTTLLDQASSDPSSAVTSRVVTWTDDTSSGPSSVSDNTVNPGTPIGTARTRSLDGVLTRTTHGQPIGGATTTRTDRVPDGGRATPCAWIWSQSGEPRRAASPQTDTVTTPTGQPDSSTRTAAPMGAPPDDTVTVGPTEESAGEAASAPRAGGRSGTEQDDGGDDHRRGRGDRPRHEATDPEPPAPRSTSTSVCPLAGPALGPPESGPRPRPRPGPAAPRPAAHESEGHDGHHQGQPQPGHGPRRRRPGHRLGSRVDRAVGRERLEPHRPGHPDQREHAGDPAGARDGAARQQLGQVVRGGAAQPDAERAADLEHLVGREPHVAGVAHRVGHVEVAAEWGQQAAVVPRLHRVDDERRVEGAGHPHVHA